MQANKLASRIGIGDLPPAFYPTAVPFGGIEISGGQKERWATLDIHFCKRRMDLAQTIATENVAKLQDEAKALLKEQLYS